MATTTNYGWTTPDDTALVKDGASAIRTLGSSVDTTVKSLSPGTTAGDIDYYTSSTAKARLAIGTTGQVLKVSGGVPTWGTAAAGQLTETVFTSSNATWTIPTGVTGVWALVVGGGGGGGASSTSTASNCGGGGGAGRVLETYFAIAGDTTLNITVGAGGAGATTTGAQGSTGSTSSIVGNTSATTYASAAGGGGGGGGTTTAGLTGASGGGVGNTAANDGGGGGGGNRGSANTITNAFWASNAWSTGGGSATTIGITGGAGGGTNVYYGGEGIYIWNRALAGGGNAPSRSANSIATRFGGVSSTANDTNATNATANTGAGGNGASTTTTTLRTGGNGGSGLVVLRYIA